MNYIEVDGIPVVEPDALKWSDWFEITDRCVASTMIGPDGISTVFLGRDIQSGNGLPLLYETLVFPGEGRSESYCERYSTREEAIKGHKKAVAAVRAGDLLNPEGGAQ